MSRGKTSKAIVRFLLAERDRVRAKLQEEVELRKSLSRSLDEIREALGLSTYTNHCKVLDVCRELMRVVRERDEARAQLQELLESVHTKGVGYDNA